MENSGKIHEQNAKKFLKRQGLKFIEANFHSRFGEIDLIMQDKHNDSLIFVEVRYRGNSSYATAAETVTQRKQKKIIKTAQYYLLLKGHHNKNVRFDVVAIQPEQGTENQTSIEWIENAFICEEAH